MADTRDDFFDSLIWRIRGFDLGDDESLRADLLARSTEDPDFGGEAWTLLGVLHLRARSHAQATASFEQALAHGSAPRRTHYLLAQVSRLSHQLKRAEIHLDAAAKAGGDEVPDAELHHARGNLRRAQGDHDGAIAQYRLGLELDPRSAPRWRDLAAVQMDMERFEEARASLLRAQAESSDDALTCYQLAVVSALTSDPAQTHQWLARALEVEPALRARARRDDRLTGLVPDPEVAALIADPDPEDPDDLDWLDAFPPWFQALRADPSLAATGLRWLGRDQSAARSDKLRAAFDQGPAGTMHSRSTLSLARELLQGRKPVALGPSSRTRLGTVEPSVLFIDVHKSDRLWLALSEQYPAFLWIDVGTTAAEIVQALAPFFPRPELGAGAMTRVARGFLGYRGHFGIRSAYRREVEAADVLELERHFATSPYLEPAAWGSAYGDDPWPDDIPAQPGLVAHLQKRLGVVGAQADGALWTSTRRTRHSRSYLTIELHPQEMFVAEVRYRPASSTAAVVEAFNQRMGTGYPTDLPLDALASLLGFGFDGIEDLRSNLDATADAMELTGLLWAVAALQYGDLAVTRIFRRYLDHPEASVRATLCNIFAAYNYESLLELMSSTEPDAEMRAQIDALLDAGLAPPQVDPRAGPPEGDEAEGDEASEASEANETSGPAPEATP